MKPEGRRWQEKKRPWGTPTGGTIGHMRCESRKDAMEVGEG